MKYTAQILLYVDEFTAENKDDAVRKVNAYIDSLAGISDKSLNWEACDFAVDGEDGATGMVDTVPSARGVMAVRISE